MGDALRIVQIAGAWARLHRAESDLLRALLSAAELAAVQRRLGRSGAAQAWVPPLAGAEGGRFAEPHGPGALYLGLALETCVAEVIHHHGLLCAASLGTPPGTRAMFRHLVFEVAGSLADVTVRHGPLHDPLDYAPSWAYARLVRAANLDGVQYRSVRHPDGRCLAVFQNRAVTFTKVAFGAIVLEWDGTASVRIA
jgi:hypothetical protein